MNLVRTLIFMLTNNDLSNYNINNDITNEKNHHVNHLIVSYSLNETVFTLFGNITIIFFLAILFNQEVCYNNVYVYGYTKWSMKILKTKITSHITKYHKSTMHN